nr:hypothetical protein SHINE37_42026 [Rhizobiaceae bacterium]
MARRAAHCRGPMDTRPHIGMASLFPREQRDADGSIEQRFTPPIAWIPGRRRHDHNAQPAQFIR